MINERKSRGLNHVRSIRASGKILERVMILKKSGEGIFNKLVDEDSIGG